MGLDTSVKQFVETLNDLNHSDEIIEILDKTKARDPEWHEAMVNTNIDIFEMSYEESASYFRDLGEDQAHKRSQSFLTTRR
jgi:hypothetical protein